MIGLYTSTSTNLQDLWITHELILFLLPTHQEARGKLLNLLGHICLEQWSREQSVEALNQAVLAHDDAVREDITNASFLEGLCTALSQRVKALHNGVDIDRHVQVTEKILFLMGDDHAEKAAMLPSLEALSSQRFEQLGSVEDLHRSVSAWEDAVHLTPEDNPEKASWLTNLGGSLITRFASLAALRTYTSQCLCVRMQCKSHQKATQTRHPC
ncbi:hypothetical protein FB45DRAFT_255723 [Roridomyces roridus]|uniref:Uncharacterized protein n=1 Tax=Roridomyces roridus TaxID=1738132 RepID=A0AAD7BAE6_9AGAR|nr:hypothetical protein FB45DRAFT_255723 [Roridomyces roridus]